MPAPNGRPVSRLLMWLPPSVAHAWCIAAIRPGGCMKPRRFGSATVFRIVAGVLCAALRVATGRHAPASGDRRDVDESRSTKTLPSSIPPAPTPPTTTSTARPMRRSPRSPTPAQIAAEERTRNVGVKVLIAPGTYRETVEIPPPPNGSADTDAPLVIESAEREQAVIDGADTEGWTPSTWKAEGPNWTHPWPFRAKPAAGGHANRVLQAAGAPPGAVGQAYRRRRLVVRQRRVRCGR